LAALAVVLGGLAVLWFGDSAVYFWFRTEPPSVAFGLLWFGIAVSVPIAAEAARRYGRRRGERGGVLVTRVSATTLVAVWCAFSVQTALWIAGPSLSS
jgi:hypothetical protein